MEGWYPAAVAAGHLVLRALGVTVRACGAAHLPASGPVVLASNHVSFPDFLFVQKALLATGRRTRFLVRGDMWDAPVVGRALDGMRHVPVDRDAPAAAYLRARRLLRDGEVVCAFPEAGISAAYVVRALMPGAVALARETGAPLVPVTLWGSQRLWPQKRAAGAPLPRPDLTRGRLVDVRVHPPMAVPPGAPLEATVRRLGERLHAGLEELQRLPEHRPRPGEYAPWYPRHLGGHALARAESVELDAMPRSAILPTWGPRDGVPLEAAEEGR